MNGENDNNFISHELFKRNITKKYLQMKKSYF